MQIFYFVWLSILSFCLNLSFLDIRVTSVSRQGDEQATIWFLLGQAHMKQLSPFYCTWGDSQRHYSLIYTAGMSQIKQWSVHTRDSCILPRDVKMSLLKFIKFELLWQANTNNNKENVYPMFLMDHAYVDSKHESTNSNKLGFSRAAATRSLSFNCLFTKNEKWNYYKSWYQQRK